MLGKLLVHQDYQCGGEFQRVLSRCQSNGRRVWGTLLRDPPFDRVWSRMGVVVKVWYRLEIVLWVKIASEFSE